MRDGALPSRQMCFLAGECLQYSWIERYLNQRRCYCAQVGTSGEEGPDKLAEGHFPIEYC